MSTVLSVRKGTRRRKTKRAPSPVTTPTPPETKLPNGLTVETIREVNRQLETIREAKRQLESRNVIPRYVTFIDPFGTLKADIPAVSVVSVEKTHSQADYLTNILPRVEADKTVSKAVAALSGIDFDTIAVRGVSGLLIGPVLAHLMGKELLVIRKGDSVERSTSYHLIEGHIAVKRYIIADDLIASGSTCVRIIHAVRKEAPKATLVGILLYNDTTEFLDAANDLVESMIRHSNDPKFTFNR